MQMLKQEIYVKLNRNTSEQLIYKVRFQKSRGLNRKGRPPFLETCRNNVDLKMAYE